VALAVGVLLGDAFIHLIPDAVARQGSVSTVCLVRHEVAKMSCFSDEETTYATG
jgi:hypothetical protein